jgi:hypothetical protein
MNKHEWNSTVFAIDREIGIERQYGVPLIDFGHPHDTRIGECAATIKMRGQRQSG